jgi:large subunit ribosomal protein L6
VSRVGRLPVTVPSGVQVDIDGLNVSVKGPRGTLARTFNAGIAFEMEDGTLTVTRESDAPMLRALHGTTRALINNMVMGVSAGFTRVLEWEGVGYRAEIKGQTLVLYLGFSHPVEVEPEEGISFDVDARARQIKVTGHDKETVGQVAANIRSIRPPEPYHGKGIHYLGEKIRRKAGKSGKGKGKK